jgi:hypothetical protein
MLIEHATVLGKENKQLLSGSGISHGELTFFTSKRMRKNTRSTFIEVGVLEHAPVLGKEKVGRGLPFSWNFRKLKSTKKRTFQRVIGDGHLIALIVL